MLEALKSLFENNAISEEIRAEIESAWNKKVEENKLSVTAELRGEFAEKYEHDKANLTDAVDNNTYGILGTATASSGGNSYANRGQIITSYEGNNSAENGNNSSGSNEVPYAIEYSGNNGAGAISHVTIAVVGSN